jgi:2-polyprenyl-3-methyl-5-hydroxy-6-metoxy-1,4-benzoquinol methylase
MKYRKILTTTGAMAQWYSAKYRCMGGTWETPAEECNKHLDDAGIKGGHLLDIGCGGGHFLEQALKRCDVVTGWDVSEVACDYARTRLSESTNWIIEPRSIERPVLLADRYDWIVSLGSLEHIIDLATALHNINAMLKPEGRWYFYVPNEAWIHEDQPNERCGQAGEWKLMFETHGLVTDYIKRWNDSTAMGGIKCLSE